MKENDIKIENKLMEVKEGNNTYQIKYIGGAEFDTQLKNNKVIILGITGVGKTTIAYRLIKNAFIQTSPTISLDIGYYQMKLNGTIMQIGLWDACGNEEFVRTTPNLFRNVTMAIIVYSINDIQSFNDANTWLNILREKSKDCLIYLIGNKIDLERKVDKETAEKFKRDYELNYFSEISAKSGFGIAQMINQIAIAIYEKGKKDQINQGKPKEQLDNNIHLERKGKRKKKKCC